MNQEENKNPSTIYNTSFGGETSSYPKHDCWYYTEAVYKIGSEGTAKICGTCDKILEFRYRSFWKRLLRVFKDF